MSSIQGDDYSFLRFSMSKAVQANNPEYMEKLAEDFDIPASLLINTDNTQDEDVSLQTENNTELDDAELDEATAILEAAQEKYEAAVARYNDLINSPNGYTEEQFKMAQEAVKGAGAVLQEISDDFSAVATDFGMSVLDIDSQTSVDVSSSAQKATEMSYSQATEITEKVETAETPKAETTEAKDTSADTKAEKTETTETKSNVQTDYDNAKAEASAVRENVSAISGELDTAKGQLNDARCQQTDAQNNLNTANLEVQNAQNQKAVADNNLNTAIGNQTEAQGNYDTAKAEYTNAQNETTGAYSDYTAAKSEAENHTNVVAEKEQAKTTAYGEQQDAIKTEGESKNAHDNAVERLGTANTNLQNIQASLADTNQLITKLTDSVNSQNAIIEDYKARQKEAGSFQWWVDKAAGINYSEQIEMAENVRDYAQSVLDKKLGQKTEQEKQEKAYQEELETATEEEISTNEAWLGAQLLVTEKTEAFNTADSEHEKAVTEQGRLDGVKDSKKELYDAATRKEGAARSKFEEASTKLNEANEKVAVAQQQANAAQVELDAKIAQRDEAQKQLDDANAKVTEAEAKIQQLGEELNKAKERLETAETKETELAEKLKTEEEAATTAPADNDEECDGITPFTPFDEWEPDFELDKQTTFAIGEEGGISPFLSDSSDTEASEEEVEELAEELAVQEMKEIEEQQEEAQKEWAENHSDEIPAGTEVPIFDVDIDFDELVEKFKKEIQG